MSDKNDFRPWIAGDLSDDDLNLLDMMRLCHTCGKELEVCSCHSPINVAPDIVDVTDEGVRVFVNSGKPVRLGCHTIGDMLNMPEDAEPIDLSKLPNCPMEIYVMQGKCTPVDFPPSSGDECDCEEHRNQ